MTRALFAALMVMAGCAHDAPAARPAVADAASAGVRACATAALGRVQQAVNRHCVGCHDASNPALDLSRSLKIENAEQITKMLSAVIQYRMPPPLAGKITDAADVRRLYPLSGELRAQLANDLRAALATQEPAAEPVLAFGARERIATMVDIVTPWVATVDIDRALGPPSVVRDVDASGIRVNLIARELCRAMTTKMTIEGHGGSLAVANDSPERVSQLLQAIYGVPPAAAELQRGITMLRAYAPLVDPPDTSLSALCTTHLAGPRLQLLRLPND